MSNSLTSFSCLTFRFRSNSCPNGELIEPVDLFLSIFLYRLISLQYSSLILSQSANCMAICKERSLSSFRVSCSVSRDELMYSSQAWIRLNLCGVRCSLMQLINSLQQCQLVYQAIKLFQPHQNTHMRIGFKIFAHLDIRSSMFENHTLIIISTMLKSFDFFRKIQTDQELTSTTGGAFTIIALIIAGILILFSLQDFYQQKYYTFLAVKNDDSQFLPMRIDITFNKLPCSGLGIQFKDELQYVENDIESKIPMFRVSKDGSIKEQYNRSPDREIEKKLLTLDLREGFSCQVQGIINLPKTPGTLEFNALGQQSILWQTDPNFQSQVRLSYRLDSLNFGLGSNVFDFPIAHKSKNIENYIKYLQGDTYNRSYVQDVTNQDGRTLYMNHIKIIPVVIEGDGKTSASENYRYSLRAGSTWSNEPFPKLMFMTQIQPINIVYRKHEPQLYELVRQLLAIVGGTVATIGLFNSLGHFLFNIK